MSVKGLCLVATLGIAGLLSQSAAAVEVFATPEKMAKGDGAAYRLTAFVESAVDAVSFVFELPSGVEKVSTQQCGMPSSQGMLVQCYYEPLTRKLAVGMLRLDGKPLEVREYDLGVVRFRLGSGVAKLQPIQVSNVTTASSDNASLGERHRDAAASDSKER